MDDDVDIVNLFDQFLKFKGHEIVAKAYNGQEALEFCKNSQNTPDIIIMDDRMPNKNGIETIKEILIINPTCKIIFASADYTIRDQALKVGAIDFLEKPIDFNTLFRMIEKYSSQ